MTRQTEDRGELDCQTDQGESRRKQQERKEDKRAYSKDPFTRAQTTIQRRIALGIRASSLLIKIGGIEE